MQPEQHSQELFTDDVVKRTPVESVYWRQQGQRVLRKKAGETGREREREKQYKVTITVAVVPVTDLITNRKPLTDCGSDDCDRGKNPQRHE